MFTRPKQYKVLSSKYRVLLSILFFGVFFAFVGYFSYQRAVAFGCFDDCFNYIGAYFMLKGRILFSEVFFNHQPFGAYLSYLVQFITHPKTIYQLVLYHRIFVFFFGFLFDIFLIKRFGKKGAFFVIFYESTKFYVFGERFLAEGLIVYPLVFLFGLTLEKINKLKLSFADLILSALFAWFVIFMREPYIPLALFLFGFLIFERLNKIRLALGIFAGLSALTVLLLPLKDYILDVFVLNAATNTDAQSLISSQTLLGFFYPITVLLTGKITLFRAILVGLDFGFLFLLFPFGGLRAGKEKIIALILTVLFLSNLRYVVPGTQFYEAFHLIIWYGLFIFATFWMIFQASKKIQTILPVTLLVFLLVCLLSPKSYVWDKVDKNAEFVTGYGNYVANGFVIKTLALPGSTVFADRIDDLLYWTADITPAYKYGWYFTGMPKIQQFSSAYQEMFSNYPPDFYLGYCPKTTHQAIYLPEEQLKNYAQINFSGKPTCIYVKKTTLGKISKEKIEEIGKYQYTVASSN